MCYDGDKTSEAAHVKSRSNHKDKKKQLISKLFYMKIEQSRRNGCCSIFICLFLPCLCTRLAVVNRSIVFGVELSGKVVVSIKANKHKGSFGIEVMKQLSQSSQTMAR